MNAKLPQEIEVWYIIPALRRAIARGLADKGLKQREIARKLGVTDAAVSQYISSKRGSEVRFSSSIKAEIKGSVKSIMEGAAPMSEVQRLCRLCKEDGLCCYIHKHHGAAKDCRICFPKKGDQ